MPRPAKKRRSPLSDSVEKKIDSEEDPIRKELEALAKIVAPCLQCTTCASSCPVFQTDSGKNPRKIIHELGKGELDGILDALDFWWCGGCYTCQVHCPQGVPLTQVLFRLKNLAVLAGKELPDYISRSAAALKTGSVVPIRDEIIKKREALGLPVLAECSTDEIGAILKATRISDVVKPSD